MAGVLNSGSLKGGGVYLYHSTATPTGNEIVSSTVAYYGGGLYVERSDVTLEGNTVANNTAKPPIDQHVGLGGGLFLTAGSNATIIANSFTSNIADKGGGLYLGSNDATLTNNVVADNHAYSSGSGIFISSSSPHLLHTTIARNTGGDGSGVYVDFYSSAALTNTVLVSNSVGVYVAVGKTVRLEGTLWGSGAWANGADWGGGGTVITGTVNVWGDPYFVDPGNGDYHIGPNSAAMDKGVNAAVRTDIDHQMCPYQAPDLGADEFWPPGMPKYVYLPLVVWNY